MKKITIAFFVSLFWFQSFCQTKSEPSNSFKNQIDIVKNELKRIELLIAEAKLDSAINLLKELPEQISGFSFIYIAEADILTQKHQEQLGQFTKDITELNIKIERLTNENNALKSNTNKEIISFIEDFLVKKDLSDKTIENLKESNDKLQNDKLKLVEENATSKSEVKRLNDSITVLVDQNEEFTRQLNSFYSAVKVGLSIGFNGFVNNQLDYLVRSDSTIRESGSRSGVSGIISAIVAIRLDERNKNNIIVNIPLGDFTSNPSQAIGLFNQRIAVGLGYARSLSKVSPNLLFSASLNISPYEQIDYKEINSKKVKLPEYTKLKPENYGATIAYSYSLTIGIVYTFNAGKK